MLHVGEEVQAAAEAPVRTLPSPVTRYYVLVILTLVAVVNTLDRQIMTIMVEPIRLELGLNDSQMGFLTGVAFALVYSTLCIPAARLADRWPRRWIITSAVAVWSVMTIACGFAQNAVQLFLARFGVGFGEAGGTSPAHALISDLFPRERRATVLAAWMVAPPLGTGIGLALGGWSLHALGWRTTFMLAGLPGLILAPLVIFTFPKVRKGMADGVVTEPAGEPFLKTLRTLLSTKALPNMAFAATLNTAGVMAASTWLPTFLERSHGLDRAQIGAGLGLALGGGSLIGSLAGGPLLDWLGRRDLRWHLWVPTITSIVGGLASIAGYLAPMPYVFPLMATQVLLGGLFAAPMIAITLNLSPVTARATALACLFFVINAVGMGLGPQAVGIISDLARPHFGQESLRIALLCSTIVAIPSSLLFYRASRSYRRDVAHIDALNRQV